MRREGVRKDRGRLANFLALSARDWCLGNLLYEYSYLIQHVVKWRCGLASIGRKDWPTLLGTVGIGTVRRQHCVHTRTVYTLLKKDGDRTTQYSYCPARLNR